MRCISMSHLKSYKNFPWVCKDERKSVVCKAGRVTPPHPARAATSTSCGTRYLLSRYLARLADWIPYSDLYGTLGTAVLCTPLQLYTPQSGT